MEHDDKELFRNIKRHDHKAHLMPLCIVMSALQCPFASNTVKYFY